MNQSLSHVAMTIPRADFTGELRKRLFEFYGDVFGWKENPSLSIAGERTFIQLPIRGQYLNLRASDEPMATTGYEHLGVLVDSPEDVHTTHAKVMAWRRKIDGVEADERVQLLYDGHLYTFRFRYLLPLAVEVQHVC